MKGFSLLEIIIVIVLISIITVFAIPKFSQINDKTHITTLKSELSLIRFGVAKSKNQKVLLLDNQKINSLDDASINKKNEKLFTKVIDFDIVSTDLNEKKIGSWAKISSNSYYFYTSTNPFLFTLEEGVFLCKSEEKLCIEIE
ncbi:MAG: prepilin-type N-terminal cleavage/methylation domain-containing protein [Aliarcobacter sp.]